jgi:hypothetical protein
MFSRNGTEEIASVGVCQCMGHVMKAGLAPHPATIVVKAFQQSLDSTVAVCEPELHSLNSTCDERGLVLAVLIQM